MSTRPRVRRREKKPGYLRLVVGVAKDNDAVLNFIKEKVQPIYEASEGLQITGGIFDENTGISWSIWDSQAAMDEAATQLQNTSPYFVNSIVKVALPWV